MNPHAALEVFVNWLLNQSLQAGVLVVVVLCVQWGFRKQLTARWRFALWWLVLLQLLLPWRPPSAFSLFNYCRAKVVLAGPRYPAPSAPLPSAAPVAGEPAPGLSPMAADSGFAPTETPVQAQFVPMDVIVAGNRPAASKSAGRLTGAPGARTVTFDDLLLPGVSVLWLLGVLALGGYVFRQARRFQRRLESSVRPVERGTLTLLEECRRELGVRRSVELLETEAVKSPALFGLLRLRLLLPTGLTACFSQEQLRFIFLHELAHVRRGDLWLNWLVTALQVMHWFNPLLWLGFARLRADRELACDELALIHVGEAAGKSYGQTIIHLLEAFNRPATIPGLVGIVEDAKQMQRRIRMIARFKRPSRWSAWAAVLVAGLAVVGLTNARTETASTQQPGTKPTNQEVTGGQTTLAGRVIDAGGRPFENASVFIHAATPRSGPAVLSPSAHPDCEKRTQTEKDGRFQFQALHRDLVFDVLVAAKGQQPQIVTNVDPVKGEVKVALKEAVRGNNDPSCVAMGRVVDGSGGLVKGAVIRPLSVSSGGVVWPGILRGLEPLAVSDEQGLFSIYRPTPYDFLTLSVAARGYSEGRFEKVESGRIIQVLRLTDGASITGRVVHRGNPVAGVRVGLCGVRGPRERSVGDYTIATDLDGRFTFENVPPHAACAVFGRVSSSRSNGATAARQVDSGAEGSKADVGDLEALPVSRVEGRLSLSDSRRVPPGTEVVLNREGLHDPQRALTDAEGRFAFAGIPAEPVMIEVHVAGFRLSTRNASRAPNRKNQLIGTIRSDKTNLLILLEPGLDLDPDFNAYELMVLRRMSLRGAEELTGKSGYAELRGTVTDRATQAPLKHFTVIPGYTERQGFGMYWRRWQATMASNGTFSVYLDPSPELRTAVRIEADGYLPKESDFNPQSNSSLTLAMEPYETLRGVDRRSDGAIACVVRLPNGLPAVGAEVALSSATRMPILAPGNFTRRTTTIRTDAKGLFHLLPLTEAHTAVVAHDQGFAEVPVERVIKEREIRLERWGRIEGTVRVGTNAAAGKFVALANTALGLHAFTFDFGSFSVKTNQQGIPTVVPEAPLGNSFTVETDQQGRFAISHVPPGDRRVMPLGRGFGPNRPATGAPVSIEPGAVATVTLGGTGRPVIGRLVLDKPEQKIDWIRQVWDSFLTIKRPAAPVPPPPRDQAGNIKFGKSAEARAYERSLRDHQLEVAADGSFRVEDVPAGTYLLRVTVYDIPLGFYPSGPSFGTLNGEVVVPEMSGGRSDEPLDLGALTIQIRESSKATIKAVPKRAPKSNQPVPSPKPEANANPGNARSKPQAALNPMRSAASASTDTPANVTVQLPGRGAATKTSSDSGLIAGIVRYPDGRPAADMPVALCTDQDPPIIGRARFVERGRIWTVTDAQGRFSFKDQPEGHTIVVAHQTGFAEEPVGRNAAGMEVKLKPWGRVEGTLRLGGRPGAGREVTLRNAPRPYLKTLWLDNGAFTVRTDEQGRYVIPFAPPGNRSLSLISGEHKAIPLQSYVVVEPGVTTRVDLGGTGRPVIGRFVVDDPQQRINWETQARMASLRVRLPAPPSWDANDLREAQLRQWAFDNSDEGQARLRRFRSFPVRISADGTFRAEDVPSGDYTLSVLLSEPPTNSPFSPRFIARHDQDVVVPDSRGDRQDEPLDLGTMAMRLPRDLKVGDPAPLFEVKDADGRSLRLADFRGKFVLLEFWSSQSQPCAFEWPPLKATWEAFGRDKRFAMIGLNLDSDAARARQHVRTNGATWPQGFLGAWSKTTLPDEYGVRQGHGLHGVPALFLIGPDGRVMARQFWGDSIKAKVEEALD